MHRALEALDPAVAEGGDDGEVLWRERDADEERILGLEEARERAEHARVAHVVVRAPEYRRPRLGVDVHDRDLGLLGCRGFVWGLGDEGDGSEEGIMRVEMVWREMWKGGLACFVL